MNYGIIFYDMELNINYGNMNWISVKDRLPELKEENNILGVFTYGELTVGHFHANMVWYDGEFIDTDTTIVKKKVTH